MKWLGYQFEQFAPLLGAIGVVVFWRYVGSPFPDSADGLFGASATVASVFASFLGVSKAIILSIKGTETYRILAAKGYTAELFRYLRSGIFASVFFASLSIFGFFVSKSALIHGVKLYSIFSNLWIFAGMLSLLTYTRITNALFKILKIA